MPDADPSPSWVDYPPPSPRRADIDAKHERLARWLDDARLDGAVLVDPGHVAWLTAGAGGPRVGAPLEGPALFLTTHQRWAIACDLDAPWLFAEELEELGFQLKEWDWRAGRGAALRDCAQQRRVAADAGGVPDAPFDPALALTLNRWRAVASGWEVEQLRTLGRRCGHALDAAARNADPGQREEQFAGHLAHRLMHHGVEPLAVEVLADGAGRQYRRGRFTDRAVGRDAALSAVARWRGLHVAAARTLSFGPPDPQLREAFDTASRMQAVLISGTRAGADAGALCEAAGRFLTRPEDAADWRRGPAGFVTGCAAVGAPLGPGAEYPLESGAVLTWQTRLGPAVAADTVLVTEAGCEVLTVDTHAGHLRTFRVAGNEIRLPERFELAIAPPAGPRP